MLIWSSFLILHDETICWILKRTSRTSICSSDGGIDVQFWSWIQNFFMQKENLRNADWNQWFANLSLVKGKGYEILARTMCSRCVISSKAKRAKMHSLLHLSSVINAITNMRISGFCTIFYRSQDYLINLIQHLKHQTRFFQLQTDFHLLLISLISIIYFIFIYIYLCFYLSCRQTSTCS